MKNILLLAFFWFLLSQSNAQNYSSQSKKAIKLYESALSEINNGNLENALVFTQKAIFQDPAFIEVYLLEAEIFHTQKKYENEIEAFQKVIDINRAFFPKIFLFLAELQLNMGKYNEAEKNINEFLTFEQKNQNLLEKALFLKKKAEFGNKQIQNPVDFKPVHLGKNVNTEFNDYWPSLTVDETQLFTTVKLHDKESVSSFKEDIYVSYNESVFYSDTLQTQWTKAKPLPPPFTTLGNEGACSISADGRILFFTRCTCADGLEKCCDIYYSVKQLNTWSEARKVPGLLNSEAWDAQPSISSTGTELYFASARKGGFGGQDIWVSKLNLETGLWQIPENLGDSINTKGNEMSPFIHPDNQTLYFASDNWLGMGKLDLFLSRKNENGKWTTPLNLGFPINTHKDDIGLITNSRGNLAYFASNRLNSDLDIFTFLLPEKIKPIPVKYIKGRVIDAKTKKTLQAKFSFIDPEKNQLLITSYSDAFTGEFFISLPVNKDYLLTVQRDKYLFYSSNFILKTEIDKMKPHILTVELQPIQIGESIILKNIFFQTASFELLEKSNYELNKLFQFLTENETITKIEIAGHTDNEGTKTYNIELSENRAKAVYNYLINKGIAKERLTYKGYGFDVPISENTTPEGKALNRRTEFKILNIKQL